MPDTNQTREALLEPGEITPDLLGFAELFAGLTPRERTQVWRFLDSLHQSKPA